jgi:hypothetical protein
VLLVIDGSVGGGAGVYWLGIVSSNEIFPLLANVSAEGGMGAF